MAAAIVQEVFERVSTDWTYDASDLKRLWGAFRKDCNLALMQLCRCLLVHVLAPQKYKGDKVVPQCLREWVKLMPQDAEQRHWVEAILSKLLQQLADWIPHEAKPSRERVLSLLVSVLRGVPEGLELDSSVSDFAVQQLRDHLRDKDDGVRELVMVALAKLVSEKEESVKENAVFEELIHALHTDNSTSVRIAVIKRLPLDSSSLEDVLRHRRDKTGKVAAAVYDRLAQDLPLLQPAGEGGVAASLEQRRALMWEGLNDSRPEVRTAALRLLEKWFAEGAAGDVLKLMEAFVPQESPELCGLLLEKLVAQDKWAPQAWLQAACANNMSLKALVPVAQAATAAGGAAAGGQWVSAISPELAFVSMQACRMLDQVASSKGRAAATRVAAVMAQAEASEGMQAEEVLEAFLPTAQEMATLCRLAAEAGPQHRYVAAQMTAIASLPHMNWVDACARAAAEEALSTLIIRVGRPDEQPQAPASTSGRGHLPPACAGGTGAWEGAVLRFATAVCGDGVQLVRCILPLVLRLAAELGVSGDRLESAVEAPLLQVLTYLHMLLVAAGPRVQPSACAEVGEAAGDQEAGAWTDERQPAGPRGPVSLAQAVDMFAWTSAGHPSPSVRAAAIRCRVTLCLRDGGAAQLPRTLAMLAPLLPTHSSASSNDDDDDNGPEASTSGAAAGSRRRGGAAAAAAAAARAAAQQRLLQQQLPRRAALQGLIDLALMWGEPAVSAELAAAELAAARARRVDAMTEQMAALGMDVDGGAGAGAAKAAAVEPAQVPPTATSVVKILLRLTEGVVRKIQGSGSYASARGLAADALLGMARMLLAWPMQRRIQNLARYQAVTAMKSCHAQEFLTRLVLARYSPSVEAEPALHAQLSVFFKAYRDAAAKPDDDGALLRSLLASAFMHAARCAIPLPAPAGAPTTARGCAVPALTEFVAELLASSAAAAAEAGADAGDAASDDDGDDPISRRRPGPEGPSGDGDGEGAGTNCAAESLSSDACVWLCELVLQELVRLASPHLGSLDTAQDKVKVYATELCKTPMRLLPALPIGDSAAKPAMGIAGRNTIRRLAHLARRAVTAVEQDLVGVAVTALKKLKDFLSRMEELQQSNTAPLSEEEAEAVVQALKEQLQSLPSLDDVNAGLEADAEWDLAPDAAADQSSGATGRRPPKARGGSKGRSTAGRQAAPAARAGGRGRRGALTAVAEDDEEQEDDGIPDQDDDDDDGRDAGATDDDEEEADASSKASRRTGTSKAGGRAKKVAGAAASQPTQSSQSAAAGAVFASQGERRSSRSAAVKATERLQGLRAKDKETARMLG